MKKFSPLLLVFAMGCLLAPVQAWAAATMTDVYISLWAMRGVGMAMPQATDPSAREIVMKELLNYSEKLTKVLAEAEKNTQNSAETKARLAEFKTAWAEFQKIRDEEVFPAVRSGDNQKVRQQMAVQNGRFRRMTLLVQPRPVTAQNLGARPAAQAPRTVQSAPIQIQTGATGVVSAPGQIQTAPAKPGPAPTPVPADDDIEDSLFR